MTIQRTGWLVLLLIFFSACSAEAQVDNSDARKQRIVDNLMHLFPQLDGRTITLRDLTAVADGMEQGSFIIDGQQQQAFLTTPGDTAFYLIAAGPFNVSKTADELAEARKEQEEAERERAKQIHNTLKPAAADMPGKGPTDAPVTIVEFSDFQCPYCANAAETINQVIANNSENVRLVYAQFPLESIHPWARAASIASLCAANQSVDAFWTLHDAYFDHQQELDSQNIIEKSTGFLQSSGIDMAAFNTCASDTASDSYKAANAQVDADLQLGMNNGVNSTPGFFINGRYISGAQSPELFQQLIDLALSEAGE